jgi:hypothetical protein
MVWMCAAGVSEIVRVFDYRASTNIVISLFVPKLQVFEIPAFFLVNFALVENLS